MPEPKGSMVNVIPTKDNVDYDRVYRYNNADAVKSFKFFNGNRDTKFSNVKNIDAQIERNEYGGQFIPTIIVDINTMGVVDGQNRLEAFRKAWANGSTEELRVLFIDVPTTYIDNLIRVLQNGKKWDNKDFFTRGKGNNVQACFDLEDWGMKHELCRDSRGCNISYTMAFLYGKRMDKEVKSLSLTLSKEQIDNAEKVYSEVEALIKALGYRRMAWLEPFTHAWFELREEPLYKMFINEMGMGYICGNIKSLMSEFQTTTKKAEWKAEFEKVLDSLYVKYRKVA